MCVSPSVDRGRLPGRVLAPPRPHTGGATLPPRAGTPPIPSRLISGRRRDGVTSGFPRARQGRAHVAGQDEPVLATRAALGLAQVGHRVLRQARQRPVRVAVRRGEVGLHDARRQAGSSLLLQDRLPGLDVTRRDRLARAASTNVNGSADGQGAGLRSVEARVKGQARRAASCLTGPRS